MTTPLMPTATAVWLVDNTTLTFEQIGAFCELHALEVQGIADDEVAIGIVGLDPISNGQLTRDEIERCTADAKARLSLAETGVPRPRARAKGARYTPLSKRQDRPDAISWTLRIHPEISDPQIVKLLGTTKATINAVRERTHWNSNNIKPQDPVSLGICTQAELDEAVTKAQAKLRVSEEREAKERAKAERAAAKAAEEAVSEAAPAETPPEEAAADTPAEEASAAAETPEEPADSPTEEAATETPPEKAATDTPAEEASAAAETPPEEAAAGAEDDSAAERPPSLGSDPNA